MIFDLLIPTKYVSETIQKERMDICKACPMLRPVSKTCKKCGCYVNLKTKIKTEQCPLSKWGKVE